MSEEKRTLKKKKSKKYPTKSIPRNRYMQYSKISEYKFLKILKGFADDIPVTQLAPKVRVSEKSIRSIYKALRTKLIPATLTYPQRFGGTGFFIYRNGRVSQRGKHFFEAVKESKIYQQHLRKHAFRIKTHNDGRLILFEVTVRVLCHVSLKKDRKTLYPEQTLTAVKQMQNISNVIKQGLKTEGFLEKYGQLVERFGKVVEKMPELLEQEELLSLKTKSKEHRFPTELLYEDLRRYLLKAPL